MANAHDHFVSVFRDRARSLPGSATPWIERLRAAALEQFAERGFPSTHEEEWKYTNVEPIARHRWQQPRTGAPVSSDQIEALDFGQAHESHRLVFVDGRYAPSLSRIGRLAQGVRLAGLGQLLAQDPASIEPILAASPAQSSFAALNTAFCTDGAAIIVPSGAVVEAPIHVLYLTTDEGVTHPRTIIVAGESSRATVIEHYSGPAAAYFTNAVTQVELAANASLEHYRLQREGAAAFHVATIASRQQRDSRYVAHSIALGGVLARAELDARLEAPGCECTLNGLYLGTDSQLLDHHARIEHAAVQGKSRVFYRGILDGSARGVFAGRVVVQKGAQKTDAHLANHNLLLSPSAEADTKPQLEIYADDVKCGHGTTVGQLDDNMLFYLRSRGISPDLASALLTYAFAHDVIGRMKLKAVRSHLEEALIARLPEGRLIRESA